MSSAEQMIRLRAAVVKTVIVRRRETAASQRLRDKWKGRGPNEELENF